MDNRVVLGGQIVKLSDTRHSPAGVPITRFVLEHRSHQQEAGFTREARCRIAAVACGSGLTQAMAGLSLGSAVRVSGFLSRANNRQGALRLVLHVEHIEPLTFDP